MIYMVCYDISNQKRLQKAAKVLEEYGIRVQKSFFQCEMEKEEMEELIKRLFGVIQRKNDSLFVYPLCDKCSACALTDGTGSLITIRPFEIL